MDFEDWIWVLIASVPDLCILLTSIRTNVDFLAFQNVHFSDQAINQDAVMPIYGKDFTFSHRNQTSDDLATWHEKLVTQVHEKAKFGRILILLINVSGNVFVSCINIIIFFLIFA